MLCAIASILTVSLVMTPAEPDARALHDAAVAAADKLAAVSYTAELKATGALSGGMPPTSGTVVIVKGGSSFEQIPARFRIEAKVSDDDPATPRSVLLAFDGKTMTLLDHTARQYGRATVNNDPLSIAGVYDPAMNLLVFNFLDKEAWGLEVDIVGMSHAGQEDVGGVKCDIVVVEHSLDEPGPAPGQEEKTAARKGPTLKVREYIGAEDHLLRRIDFPLQLPDEGGGEPSTLTISLTDVKADPAIDAATFAVEIPEGYAERPGPEAAMDGPAAPMLKAGDEAPAWTLRDAEGKSQSLADYRGRVVLMDFWATWCGPCRMSMPGVQKIHDRFKDRGVAVLGINIGEDDDADPAGYMKEKGFTYGLLLRGELAAEAYGVMSIPHFFVIGVDGKIIHASVGFDEEEAEKIASLIEAHLKEQGK